MSIRWLARIAVIASMFIGLGATGPLAADDAEGIVASGTPGGQFLAGAATFCEEGAMNAWRLRAAAIIVVASALVTVGARAQPYSGSGDYQAYCASCHGADARGDGVIAKSLKKRPADLTQLTKRNNGVFPDEKVFKTIDGRQPGSAHSDPEMPAWGEVLARSSESTGAENAAARIDVLVKFLQTLQAK